MILHIPTPTELRKVAQYMIDNQIWSIVDAGVRAGASPYCFNYLRSFGPILLETPNERALALLFFAAAQETGDFLTHGDF